MKKEELRPVEVVEPKYPTNKWGEIESYIPVDKFIYDGLFHGWDCSEDLKAIVEVDGEIHLVPYSWIKFLD